jgi:hypothetical protein
MVTTTLDAERPPTYEDASLLLRLYELRREEKMRTARTWFMKNFRAKTLKEFQNLCPLGSEENAYYRMVVSYWEMAASFVTAGVLHRDLFTQNCSELLFVWERIRDVAPALREDFTSAKIARNIETLANTMTPDRMPESAFGI